MWRAVFWKEWLVQLASWRFVAGTTITCVLSGLATWVAVDHFNQRFDNHQRQLAADETTLEAVTVYSMVQPVVRRPPALLAVLDEGLEGHFGDAVPIDLFSIPDHVMGAQRRNPYLATARDIDFAAVVRLALGLLALLMTFDAVTSEARSGTLRLMLASGLTRPTVVFGKVLGAKAAIMVALLAAALPAVVILLVRARVTPTADDWWRIGGLLGWSGLYLGVMTTVGLAISVLVRRPSSALSAAMLTWIATVVLLPRLAITAGPANTPSNAEQASIAALIAERDARLDALWIRDPVRTEVSGHASPFVETAGERGVVRRYGSARYYDSVARFHQKEIALGQEYAERIERVRASRPRPRFDPWAYLAWLSPAFLYERVAEGLTATSTWDQAAFLRDCRTYRLALIDALAARDAFGSWRWFTDDPTPPPAWPSLFGLTPDEVDADNIAAFASRFRSPSIQARFQRDRSDPNRLLDLDWLPRLNLARVGLLAVLHRLALDLGILLLQGVLALVFAMACFARERRV